jgi:hypothetical protein
MNEDPLFSKLKGTLSSENQAVLEAARGIREQQLKSYSDAKMAESVDLAKKRNEALQQHDASFIQSIPEEVRAAKYPGIEWDYNAGKNAINYQYQLGRVDLRDPGASSKISIIDKTNPEDQRKPFNQTEDYKFAQKDWHAGHEPYRIATSLGDQMMQMRKHLDAGDREAALDIAKSGLMKTVNSIQGKDAVSLGEQMTRFGSVITAPEYALQSGGNLLTTIGGYLISKGKMSEKDGKDVSDKIRDAIDVSFNADPDRFYKMSTGIYEAAKDTANQHVTRIENMTSPFHAKAMGAVKLPDMSLLEARMQNRMNPPGPGAVQNPSPMSGGAPVISPKTMTGGAGATGSSAPAVNAQQLQHIIDSPQFTPEQKAAASRLLNK